MLLAIAFSTALAIIAIITSVSMAVYAYQQRPGPDTSGEGSRFGLSQNRMEPGAPSPWGGGAPRWRPPLLSRTLTQPNLNELGSYDALPKLRLLFDTGTGPQSGADLHVWLDKTAIFEVVNGESLPDERRLTDLDGTRTSWYFPKDGVQRYDVRIYLDGDLYGVLPDDPLSDLATSIKTTSSENLDQVKIRDGFLYDKYNSAITLGPSSWQGRDQFRVWANLVTSNQYFAAAIGNYSDERTGYILLTSDMYEIRQLTDGSAQIVLNDKIEIPFSSTSGWSGAPDRTNVRSKKAVSIKVEYPGPDADLQLFDLETCEHEFRTKAVFRNAVPAGEVEAHYKVLPYGVEVKAIFQPGDIDQEAVPLDFNSQSRAVNLQLAQAIRRTYSTTVEVDDLVVGLSSGSGGFFRQGKAGTSRLDMDIRIRFKKSDAPDAPASTFGTSREYIEGPGGTWNTTNVKDPSTGWVEARFGKNQSAAKLRIHSETTGGLARWAFRLSDAWRYALIDGGIPEVMANKVLQLPRGKWDIDVVRITTDDIEGQAELYLEHVTETVFDRFNFPRRSMLLIEYDEQEGLDATPEVEVQYRMMKCRRYTGTEHVTRAEQLGRWIASRQGPKQIALPDGTVLTTPGPYLDLSEFTYDPELYEPRFVREWTRNPVWVATELILDELSGGGTVGYDPRRSVDWESALVAANYCDEQIEFDGTTDTRSEADIVFVRRVSLFDAISQIVAGSGVAPAFSRGKWFFPVDDDSLDPDVVTDKLTGSGFVLSDADILDATVEGGNVGIVNGLLIDTKQIEGTATDLEITFPDEEAGFDQSADPVYIPADKDALVRHVRRASFPAVRRRWQAERVGNAMLKAEDNNHRIVTAIPANFRTLPLEPGDVIWFGSETAKLSTRKAQVIERVPGGSNLQQEIKLLLLDMSERLGGSKFAGPTGGVVPGLRKPTSKLTGNPQPTSKQRLADTRSYIVKAEEL